MRHAREPSAEGGDSVLTLRFMLAARQRELQAMRELAHTCELVIAVGQLVHALQKERGQATQQLSTPTGDRQGWQAQMAVAMQAEAQLRERLAGELDPALPLKKARWLHAVAHALHGLDGLGRLRHGQRHASTSVEAVITAYSRVIGSLLGVVIEALEGPADPSITELLVALLNFMQAKELCGQERAHGVAGFAQGRFDADRQALLLSVRQAQTRSFTLFAQHAPAPQREAWTALQADELALQRLRQLSASPEPVAPALAPVWFDVCTARIDALHALEQQLAHELARRCGERMHDTAQALADLDELAAGRGSAPQAEARTAAQAEGYVPPGLLYTLVGQPMGEAVMGDAIGSDMARSVLDVLLAQGARLHEADLALAQARRVQQERRRIEQAKWWLVSHYQLSEAAAHERMQRTAMNAGLSLHDVAERLLAESAAGPS